MFAVLQQHPVAALLICGAFIGIICRGVKAKKNRRQQKSVNPPRTPQKPRTAEVPRAQPDPEIQRLAQELATLERELEWLDGLNQHSKFLHSLLAPVQVLIGCSDAPSALSENQKLYFLEPRALQPLSAAAEPFRRLPRIPSAPVAASAANLEEYQQMSAENLRDKVKERKRQVRVNSYLQRDYELLLEFEKAGLFRLSEAEAAAAGKKAAEALRRHGIFPLYRDEVTDQPDLWDSFNEGSSLAIACPGLFLYRDGGYELLSIYNGIWV